MKQIKNKNCSIIFQLNLRIADTRHIIRDILTIQLNLF